MCTSGAFNDCKPMAFDNKPGGKWWFTTKSSNVLGFVPNFKK